MNYGPCIFKYTTVPSGGRDALIFDTLLFKTYFGGFMVKQDFKNNPVIGMSAAAGSSVKLLC